MSDAEDSGVGFVFSGPSQQSWLLFKRMRDYWLGHKHRIERHAERVFVCCFISAFFCVAGLVYELRWIPPVMIGLALFLFLRWRAQRLVLLDIKRLCFGIQFAMDHLHGGGVVRLSIGKDVCVTIGEGQDEKSTYSIAAASCPGPSDYRVNA